MLLFRIPSRWARRRGGAPGVHSALGSAASKGGGPSSPAGHCRGGHGLLNCTLLFHGQAGSWTLIVVSHWQWSRGRSTPQAHTGCLSPEVPTQTRYGTALKMDSLWNRWFRRQRLHAHAPEVAPPRFWARFPSHWCHGIARHLEGCAVSHRSIRE
jgi:hypothetical protein